MDNKSKQEIGDDARNNESSSQIAPSEENGQPMPGDPKESCPDTADSWDAIGESEQQPRMKVEGEVILVAVRLRPGYIASHYDANGLDLDEGEWVVVNTDHGPEVGRVTERPFTVLLPDREALPKVDHIASTDEINQYGQNLEREKEAWKICEERIAAHNLSMKLVRVESFFDGSKIIFYYSAESRVDFRELVKDLVKALHTRIEMRQIGIRHEAKMVGGIGSCGRQICCVSFLKDFDPISIKMAKAQNLPLNPSKISGLCGRLLCCLTYEYDTYVQLKKEMPTLGKPCQTPVGSGKVIRQNILRQTVTVALPGGGEAEFKACQLDGKKCQVDVNRSTQIGGIVESKEVLSPQKEKKEEDVKKAEKRKNNSQKKKAKSPKREVKKERSEKREKTTQGNNRKRRRRSGNRGRRRSAKKKQPESEGKRDE